MSVLFLGIKKWPLLQMQQIENRFINTVLFISNVLRKHTLSMGKEAVLTSVRNSFSKLNRPRVGLHRTIMA